MTRQTTPGIQFILSDGIYSRRTSAGCVAQNCARSVLLCLLLVLVCLLVLLLLDKLQKAEQQLLDGSERVAGGSWLHGPDDVSCCFSDKFVESCIEWFPIHRLPRASVFAFFSCGNLSVFSARSSSSLARRCTKRQRRLSLPDLRQFREIGGIVR